MQSDRRAKISHDGEDIQKQFGGTYLVNKDNIKIKKE